MKKLILSAVLMISSSILFSQNIGIGTTTPSARLTVEGNELTPNGQAAAIKIQNTSSTNAWYMRAGGNGTTTPLGGFSLADNTGYHFNIASGGNIGIGMMPTTALLHVNGEMRLQGLNLFEFGAGVPNKEVNAGKIGYNAFGQNGLVFIGGGSTNLNRSIFFFAEGGTTMNGPLNFNGPLRVNGNPGTAGQVLTSNGTSVPEWSNAAYSNNIRFSFSIAQNTSSDFGDCRIVGTNYNLNTSVVTVGTNSITINRAGLYHFEVSVVVDYAFPTTPSTGAPNFTFNFKTGVAAGNSYNLISRKQMEGTGAQYRLGERQLIDLYITQPTTISLAHSFSNSTNGFIIALSGHFTGYLISE